MAAPSFPQRKTSGGGGMTATSGSVLDGPPPSPVMAQAQTPLPTGAAASQPLPSFDQMSAPMTAGTPGRATSPEIAMGMMQTAETIYGILDSMASIAPDLANDFAMQKDFLQRTMGKLLVKNGQPAAPNAPGMNFPGGGFLSGMP